MEHILPIMTLVAAGLAGAAVIYSIFALLRARKPSRRPRTSSTAAARVDMENMALDLIAVMEPSVKKLLSPPPDEIIITKTASEAPEWRHEAAITARRGGAEAQQVVFDLRKRRDLEALIDVLLSGEQEVHLQEVSLAR